MKHIDAIKKFLIAEMIIYIVILFILYVRGTSYLTLFFLLAMQISVFYVFNICFITPLRNFEIIVKKALDGEIDEEELKTISVNALYIDELKEIVNYYTTQRTRKNSVQIFDKQTELTALQSQINPHFLYNTLESIRGQALIDDNEEIANMVETLGAFFRYSISKKGNLVKLREEIANIKNYMKIQSYRFNNRFSMEILIDEKDEVAYDYLIPRLTLQPVIENAITHGLNDIIEEGIVTIEIIVTESNLIITISDNGIGIEKDKLMDLNNRIRSKDIYIEDKTVKHSKHTGIALPNIHKRIQLLFGEEYGVNVYSTVGQGTDVEITIPARNERNIDSYYEKRDVKNQ